MHRTDALDLYVSLNQGSVATRFRPKYHLSSPIGWINDPNGFVHAFGKTHLFAQFYPFAMHWGEISWAHAVTEDFVRWSWQKVAIAPELWYEEGIGIMSGTSLLDGDKLLAFYASGSRINDVERQQISFATSTNGTDFVKSCHNPVIKTQQIPSGFSKVHFRDPKIFVKNGVYYLLVTTVDDTDKGNLLLYSSKNYVDWTYVGDIIKKPFDMRGAIECPDYFQLNGKDVIVCSPQFLRSDDGIRHQNVHSSIYMVGQLDLLQATFNMEHYNDIDSGTDFYAPQTLLTPDGRRVMTAWMNNWDKTYPSAVDGWVGSMILPRELELREGKLFQQPVAEINAYRKNAVGLCNVEVGNEVSLEGVNGNCIDVEMDVDLSCCDTFGIRFFANSTYNTHFYYCKNTQLACLDRSNGGIKITSTQESEANIRRVKVKLQNNRLRIRMLLDISCAEIFLQNGESVLTTTVFPPTSNENTTASSGISFYANGKATIISLNKYNIIV